METNKEKYERELKEKQRAQLEGVRKRLEANWTPCKHDECTECFGTSIKRNGTVCSHYLVCNCPKCSVPLGASYSPYRSPSKVNGY